MADRDNVKATVGAFCAAVAASQDAGDPSVSEPLGSCREALATWIEGGARLPAAEPVLQGANAVLNALHELNPEGLPFAYRDWAAEMLTVLDEAEAEGFQVSASAAPTP